MNNIVATQFENIDKLYKGIPSKGTANIAEENGPLNFVANSMINANIANNRFEYIKTILQRSENPYGLGPVMIEANKYEQAPDVVKTVIVDVLGKLLNYKDPNNIDATIRADIDYRLHENPNRINYNDVNMVSSGDSTSDLKILTETLSSLGMEKPLLNDPTGATGTVIDMLVILKSSGNTNAYNMALDLLNKAETFASVKKVIGKAVAVASQVNVGFNSPMANGNNSNVAFNRNLVAGATMGGESIDGMIATMSTALTNIVTPFVQRSNPQMLNLVNYLNQSIPTLINLDSVRTFNALITLNENIQISPNERPVIEAAYGRYKAIFGPDGLIQTDLRNTIAFGYLAIKLMETVQIKGQQGQLSPEILNGLVMYYNVLNFVAYGQDVANVVPEKLTLNDTVAVDIQSGKPFFTLGLFGNDPLISTAAKTLFVINPTNGLPLLNPKNIIDSSGTAYTGSNQGINFIMVRTFLEKIPQLKPYATNAQQLDTLAQAITSSLMRLNLHV